MDYLIEAKKLLNQEYREKYALAHTDYQKAFMDEKIKHSYQVLGAGNYLLKHEQYFSCCSREERNYYQAIVLLHDICRFYEIVEKEKGHQIDHGVCSAEFLENVNLFNRADAILSIKHHGHLIEKLYEDECFLKLSAPERAHVEKVSFLVRDADKIANLYLLSLDFDKIERIFFVLNDSQDSLCKVVSPKILDDFMAHRSVNKKNVKSFADHALMILAWLYDLNYRSSFVFLQKLDIINKLCVIFSKFWRKEDCCIFQNEIIKYVQERLNDKKEGA